MEKNKFEELVLEIIKEVPEKFRKKLNNVEVIIDYDNIAPSPGKEKNRITLGLFQGTPNTVKPGHNIIFPDKITIFKKALDSVSKNDEELKKNLKIVIFHEIGHYFGLDEEKLRELGYQL